MVSFRYHAAMATQSLHALLACLSRVLQSEQRQQAVAAGLPAVQWTILQYLRQANRYSNTPQALGEYLGLTKGTVSQSLKRLEARGWVKRVADARDGRVVRLALTRGGLKQVDDSIDTEWAAAAASLPGAERNAAEAALTRLLAGWQQSRQGRSFGVCRSCANFQAGPGEHRCGLTGEPLSEEDSTRICREHT
jgi:DNA-binding MarR family transcriptional regulator